MKEIKTQKNLKCPMCFENSLTISIYENSYPVIGKATFIGEKCLKCGYKHNQTLTQNKGKKIYKLKINNLDDLKVKILKSKGGKISFSNIEIEVESLGDKNDFITNVEGVIKRFIQNSKLFLNSLENKNEISKTKKIIEDLEMVLKGQKKTTLILKDKLGESFIDTENKIKS